MKKSIILFFVLILVFVSVSFSANLLDQTSNNLNTQVDSFVSIGNLPYGITSAAQRFRNTAACRLGKIDLIIRKAGVLNGDVYLEIRRNNPNGPLQGISDVVNFSAISGDLTDASTTTSFNFSTTLNLTANQNYVFIVRNTNTAASAVLFVAAKNNNAYTAGSAFIEKNVAWVNQGNVVDIWFDEYKWTVDNTPTYTSTNTYTVTNTNTPSDTYTFTNTATSTFTPSNTPTYTATSICDNVENIVNNCTDPAVRYAFENNTTDTGYAGIDAWTWGNPQYEAGISGSQAIGNFNEGNGGIAICPEILRRANVNVEFKHNVDIAKAMANTGIAAYRENIIMYSRIDGDGTAGSGHIFVTVLEPAAGGGMQYRMSVSTQNGVESIVVPGVTQDGWYKVELKWRGAYKYPNTSGSGTITMKVTRIDSNGNPLTVTGTQTISSAISFGKDGLPVSFLVGGHNEAQTEGALDDFMMYECDGSITEPADTVTVTNTYTSTNTSTNTYTVTNTNTPSDTYTFTYTVTNTNTPSYTYTLTHTVTNTNTPSYTYTFTHTVTNTNTPSYTYTFTRTATNTNTPSDTYTFTHTATNTNTVLNTPTHTATLICDNVENIVNNCTDPAVRYAFENNTTDTGYAGIDVWTWGNLQYEAGISGSQAIGNFNEGNGGIAICPGIVRRANVNLEFKHNVDIAKAMANTGIAAYRENMIMYSLINGDGTAGSGHMFVTVLEPAAGGGMKYRMSVSTQNGVESIEVPGVTQDGWYKVELKWRGAYKYPNTSGTGTITMKVTQIDSNGNLITVIGTQILNSAISFGKDGLPVHFLVGGHNEAQTEGALDDFMMYECDSAIETIQAQGTLLQSAAVDTKSVKIEPVAEKDTAGAFTEDSVYSYPNPAKDKTIIRFELSSPSKVSIALFDISGNLVWNKNLSEEETVSGVNRVIWNGVNASGNTVANGVYMLSVKAAGKIVKKTIVLMK